MRSWRAAACGMGLALGLGLAPVAADDRAPTAEELAAIEAALHAAGYTRWEEIEWDDGGWEVDDARGADGREVDLWLEPDTLAIRAEREDG